MSRSIEDGQFETRGFMAQPSPLGALRLNVDAATAAPAASVHDRRYRPLVATSICKNAPRK
jgi:hypothetical protein